MVSYQVVPGNVSTEVFLGSATVSAAGLDFGVVVCFVCLVCLAYGLSGHWVYLHGRWLIPAILLASVCDDSSGIFWCVLMRQGNQMIPLDQAAAHAITQDSGCACLRIVAFLAVVLPAPGVMCFRHKSFSVICDVNLQSHRL
jgi:hypothetical protein